MSILGIGVKSRRRPLLYSMVSEDLLAAERWRSPGEVTAASDRWFGGGDDMVVGFLNKKMVRVLEMGFLMWGDFVNEFFIVKRVISES
nr:hypothetical protein [Tanacetum cinerariifolium]